MIRPNIKGKVEIKQYSDLGTAGTVLSKIVAFGEPFKPMKIVLILVLLTGVIGLKLVTGKLEREEVAA